MTWSKSSSTSVRTLEVCRHFNVESKDKNRYFGVIKWPTGRKRTFNGAKSKEEIAPALSETSVLVMVESIVRSTYHLTYTLLR